jgi:hypothetical protein
MVMTRAQGAILEGREEQWKQFTRAHPRVVRALQVFRISQQQYEKALGRLYGPRIVTSNSTATPEAQPGETNGDVE